MARLRGQCAAQSNTWQPPMGKNSATDRACCVELARVNICLPDSPRLAGAIIHCSTMHQTPTDRCQVQAIRRQVVVRKRRYIVLPCIRQTRTPGHTRTLIGKHLGSGSCNCHPPSARELAGPVEVHHVPRGRYCRLTTRGQRFWQQQRRQWTAFTRTVNVLLNPPSRHSQNR